MFNFIYNSFKERSLEKELMDNPLCDKAKLINTVKQFKLLNILFTSSRFLIKRYIISVIKKSPSREYSFLDIGGGGADIAIWLAKFCNKKRLKVFITVIDTDKTILSYAKEKTKDFNNIKVVEKSAFSLDKETQIFDFIFANHFLHHLSDKEIKEFISLIKIKTNLVFLINDIKRSSLAYLLYSLFTIIFCHNSFAFYDGRVSIKRGFKKDELISLINDKDVLVKEAFPFRIVALYSNLKLF